MAKPSESGQKSGGILSTRYLTPMVFAALLLLLGIVAAAAWSSFRQQAENDRVRHSFEVEQQVARAMSLLQDAETGQRGYLLAGRDDYLAPYTSAVPEIGKALDVIGALVSDNPEQTANLAELRKAARDKLAELDATIDQARSGNRAAALDLVKSDVGKATMDRARAIVEQMRAVENRLLNARMDMSRQTGGQLRLIIYLSAILIVMLGVLVFLAVRRFTRALMASRNALAEKNAALVQEMATRERIEGQLIQSQKMDAIGQLTGGVAHDFNNMHAVVIGALTLLKRRMASGDPNAGQFAEAALDGARRAASLTSRLLAFSRQQALSPESIDANRMVGGMSELLHRTLGEQIELQTVLAGGLWRTLADPSQLENSVLNLAVNARDAMTGGGKITIETANCHLDDTYAASNHGVPPGQYVLIAVSDTGPGMTPEVLAKAFDPFFTTKPAGKGTGLGLSQVYGFVKQSGGHIKIYSEIGQGTVVKIYLPRSYGTGEMASMPVRETLSLPPVDSATVVLVVEDDESVRLVTVASLRELGYTVVHASRPSEALKIIEQQPRIDVLLTDVVMPEMNGRKLADTVLKSRPDLRVLFTTGYTQNAIVHNGVLDPGTELLMKPFSVDQLAVKMASILGKPAG